MEVLNLCTRTGIAGLLVLCGGELAYGGEDQWTPAGTQDGGTVSRLAVVPGDPPTVYAVAGLDVWKSTNGGATWTPSRPGPTLSWRTIAVDPADANQLFVGGFAGSIHSSDDAAATWADKSLGTTDRVDDIHVTPAGVVFAATTGGIHRSSDKGDSWELVTDGLEDASGFAPLFPRLSGSPADPTTLYAVGGDRGVYRSRNEGAWRRVDSGLSGRFTAVAADPSQARVVYAASNEGIFGSSDRGANWSHLDTTVTSATDLFLDPAMPAHLLASTPSGLLRSTDSGSTWAPTATDLSAISINNVESGSGFFAASALGVLSSLDGDTWAPSNSGLLGHRSRQLLVDPVNPERIYSFDQLGAGLFRSLDGGSTWSPANEGLGSIGLTAPTGNGGSAIALTAPMTLFSVGRDSSQSPTLYKSTNGATSWLEPITDGSPLAGTTNTAVTVDPSNAMTVYLGQFGFEVGNPTGPGIFRSSDGGSTFTRIFTPPASNIIQPTSIAVDPADPQRVLWGGFLQDFVTPDSTVQLSSDGGANWMEVIPDVGFPNIQFAADGTLYVGAAPWPGGVLGGFFKSTDGGATFEAKTNGLPDPLRVSAFDVHPTISTTLYATDGALIFSSGDGAESWDPVPLTGLPEGGITTLQFVPGSEGPRLLSGTVSGIWEICLEGADQATVCGSIFTDGFESGDVSRWSRTVN